MHTVEVRLYAGLQRFLKQGATSEPTYLEVAEGTTLSDLLLDTLQIPSEEFKMAMVNGVRCDLEYVLQDGDRIGVFPPIGGG